MPQLPIPPALVLALLLATGYAAGFHVIFGGSVRRLVLYILAAWTGFAAGQWLGGAVSLAAFDIGSLHVVAASLACGLTLFLTRWLAQLPPVEAQE